MPRSHLKFYWCVNQGDRVSPTCGRAEDDPSWQHSGRALGAPGQRVLGAKDEAELLPTDCAEGVLHLAGRREGS